MEQTLNDIVNFLFNTFGGVGVLLGSSIVICIIACAIMEHRQKKALRLRHEAMRNYDEVDEDEQEEE